MAASAQTVPENASSQFNGIKSRTGVFPYIFQIHLVYLKIMSKSTGISNTRHLSSARYTKQDAAKAGHAVLQPFSLVWISTNIQRNNWTAAENSKRKIILISGFNIHLRGCETTVPSSRNSCTIVRECGTPAFYWMEWLSCLACTEKIHSHTEKATLLLLLPLRCIRHLCHKKAVLLHRILTYTRLVELKHRGKWLPAI